MGREGGQRRAAAQRTARPGVLVCVCVYVYVCEGVGGWAELLHRGLQGQVCVRVFVCVCVCVYLCVCVHACQCSQTLVNACEDLHVDIRPTNPVRCTCPANFVLLIVDSKPDAQVFYFC